MAVMVGGFTYGGIKLDEAVSGVEFPLFTMVGAILGVVLGVYITIRDVTKL